MFKKILLFLLFCCYSNNSFAQEIKYKEYSYTKFFQLIENEKDTVFNLKDAIIKFNPKTDSIYAAAINIINMDHKFFRKELITIDKELKLDNVQFLPYFNKNTNLDSVPDILGTGFFNMVFLKPVTLINTISLNISNCTFKKAFILSSNNDELVKAEAYFKNNINTLGYTYQDIYISKNTFTANSRIDINNYKSEKLSSIMIHVEDNLFNGNYTYVRADKINYFLLRNNKYNSITRPRIVISENNSSEFVNNHFNTFVELIIGLGIHSKDLTITNNKFPSYVIVNSFSLTKTSKIDWNQWDTKIVLRNNIFDFNRRNAKVIDSLYKIGIDVHDEWERKKERVEEYINNAQTKVSEFYLEEIKFRYEFYNHYKSKYDLEKANLVYADIKDLETKRFGHLYSEKSNFKTFFKWRINQFLKVFSGYGKEPEKAVVFSMYVILLFAFIYLLFPNSWDSHGRKRIMDRYAFFFTYMNKKAGIHEVYLDNQKEDLLEFDEFKDLVAKQGKTVPKFFTTTALPLYKWAISGTKFSAIILKRVDIMKGSWNEVPKKKRIWKSFLLIGAFIIAICYDILIKMLNALMLSINTFTTLGFGEIPIKGLPRYLAIIQGFIGWFMLTIFSVSLISQLLN